MKYLFCLCFIYTFYCIYADYRQEKARLMYSNPKYIKDCSVVNGLRNRNDSYYSNLTLTTLKSFSNNVSMSVTLELVTGGEYKVSNKFCTMLQKEVWIINYLKVHSDAELSCPLPQGTYHLFNVIVPPKNMPVPMLASDYYITLEVYLTSSKEQILKVFTSLLFEDGEWKKYE